MSRRATVGGGFPDVMMSVVLGTFVICGGVLMYNGVDPLRAQLAGTSGHVTVTTCEWLDGVPGADGYECRGVFNGVGLRVEDVRIDSRFLQEPVNPVAALVTGPDAKTAHTPGWELLGPFAAGIVMMGIGLAYVWRSSVAR